MRAVQADGWRVTKAAARLCSRRLGQHYRRSSAEPFARRIKMRFSHTSDLVAYAFPVLSP